MDKDLKNSKGEKPDAGQRHRSRSKAAARARRNSARKNSAGENSAGKDSTGKSSPGHKPRLIAGVFLALALAACVGGYVYRSMGFRTRFLPHTVVNGMDVSGRTPQEARDMISSGIRSYRLVLKLRDGSTQSISGADMGLKAEFDGSLDEIMRQQNPYAWPRYLLKGPDYDIQTMITFDKSALDESLEKLDCFNPAKITMPRDAYLSDYVKGKGYSIVPETEGNELDLKRVEAAADKQVHALSGEMDLDALGCYLSPRIRADNSSLVAARDARNRYVNMVVTYTFGSASQVLDGETIHNWLVPDGGTVTLDSGKIAAYIKDLASKYNTAYTTRPFKTSYGQTVDVSGFYGWRINQAAETKELTKILEAGKNTTREPIYSQTAASHDGPDYGNTYAEVNLTAQHMFLYKDGEKILESDFVSGSISKGHTTPPGIYSITYKQKDAVLKGQGYASPVKYWMPFNGGIGFHDASWRSSFGGSIYQKGGSHGCVNMPYLTAEKLFQNVYKGMPVICYDLPGTETKKPSKASGSAPAPTLHPAAAPAPSETGAPVPPAGGAPVPPAGGAPVPPAGGAPVPPAGSAPVPPAGGAPVPPAGGAPVPPAGGAPVPPAGGAPVPPEPGAPVPPAGGPPGPGETPVPPEPGTPGPSETAAPPSGPSGTSEPAPPSGPGQPASTQPSRTQVSIEPVGQPTAPSKESSHTPDASGGYGPGAG